MAMAAAAVELFHALAVPCEQHPVESNEALMFWGATSSVGVSAVQIARVFSWKILRLWPNWPSREGTWLSRA